MRTDGPVVIALDGSPRSGHTLTWGLDEAERRDADAVLARAYQEPAEYARGWYPAMGDPGIESEAKEYLAELLEREAARRPHMSLHTSLLHGPAVPELRELSHTAQLLVVGAGVPGAAQLGSVPSHLAMHALCPVAIVRPRPAVGRSFSGRDGEPGAVVVGVDGSRSSVRAAEAAAAAADARGTALTIVHARPTIPAPFGRGVVPPVAAADEHDPAHVAARLMARELRSSYPDLTVRLVLVDDDPARAIVAAAKDAQLAVVGSRGLGAFRGLLLGSVSQQVARSAPCPVLVMQGVLDDA